MLIAEDLLLLLYDDESGKPSVDATKLDNALAGAVLLELAMLGKVGVAGPGERVREGRLVLLDPAATGDEVLDDGLTELSDDEGKKPKNVLGALRKGLRQRLLETLTDRGLVRQEEGRILGLFPTTRWPASDAEHEAVVRDRLHAVLVAGAEPDARTAALVSLLLAVDAVTQVVPSDDRRTTKRRAKQVADGAWAAAAVRAAVQEVNAAVASAIVVAGTTGAAGGGI
ncbi:GOLPH3/VPS74 family protein [Jiangella asiatica]|uniref:GPP34 family phosphoprotein n=1 Tax=Jiangella asiatica TaxID=2530372 RepID=A0A4R5D7I4_9ACTN|nr:GPP34 family phosphoprotein [Jiangella asiatica]TDE09482.1 GPP34 family phosphoprotein [Jiangella asiatica]